MKYSLLILLLWCNMALASTHYVDYAGGSDSNAGTSTASPWKLCPGMSGFSGTYSHAAGDIFIFKGGVTWPTNAFQFQISNSGVSGNNDIYKSDSSYYAGASWTRPVFDIGYNTVSGNSVIYVTGSYVTVSGIEIKGLRIPNSGSWNAFGVSSVQSAATTVGITVQNCYIHNWRAGTATNDINFTDSDFGGIYFGGSGGVVLQNTIGPGEAPLGLTGNSGCGVAGGAILIQSNTFIGCTEMINAGATNISFNTFRNGTNSYDPQDHANAIYHGLTTGGRAYIYNNTFHDLGSTFQTMLLHPGSSGATNAAYYIYNNVIWNVSSPVDIDEAGIVVSNSATYAHIYNNTIQHDITVGAVKRGQTFHLTEIDCRNNHWISDAETSNPIGTAATTSAYAPVGTLIDSSNLWQTAAEATSAGYVIANEFSPTSVVSPTVGMGENLTSSNLFTTDLTGGVRPSSGAWDIGAYEFMQSEESPPAVTGGSVYMRLRK